MTKDNKRVINKEDMDSSSSELCPLYANK